MTPDTAWTAAPDRAPPPEPLPSTSAVRALYGVVLSLVLLAGGLSLAMPFWGDQALFAVYGRQLSDGAVLYRDLFDLKQPGIFAFYALGGLLFGFTEVGIHLFELTYWVAFSLFAVLALRPYLTTRWAVPLVPGFTVVVYYLYAQTVDLTQIEAVVALPILIAWWLIDQADPALRSGLGRYAAAGVAAAAVVLLKHLYVVIIVGFLVYSVLRSRRQGTPIADIGRSVWVFVIGMLAPLLFVAGYFAAHGQLERIWWAYVEYPGAARALDPAPLDNLTGGARRFMVGHAPFLILAVLGSVHALRHRTRPQLHLVAGMVLWLAVGFALVLVQFWGEWHWLLFTVPSGLLAVLGIEALTAMVVHLRTPARLAALGAGGMLGVLSFFIGASTIQAQKWLLLLIAVGSCAAVAVVMLARRARIARPMLLLLLTALIASFGLAAIAPVNKLQALIEHDFALHTEARVAFQGSWNPAYRAAHEDLAHLHSGDVLPGPLYVFGDPVVLLRSGRPQAAAMHGWGPEKLLPRAWQELHRDLRSASPPYIVVDGSSESIIRVRDPALMEFIEARYEPAFVGASGTWYVRRQTDA